MAESQGDSKSSLPSKEIQQKRTFPRNPRSPSPKEQDEKQRNPNWMAGLDRKPRGRLRDGFLSGDDETLLVDTMRAAKKKILTGHCEAVLRKKIASGAYDDDETIPQWLQEYWAKLQEDSKEKDEGVSKKGNSRAVWVTINPRPGVVFKDFALKVDSLPSRLSWIEWMAWAFEVTRNDNRSPHVHILLYKTKKGKRSSELPNRVIAAFKRNFEQFCDVEKKSCLNVKHIPSDTTSLEEKLEYLQGIKWDKEKLPDLDATEKWREEMKIQPVYGYNVPEREAETIEQPSEEETDNEDDE